MGFVRIFWEDNIQEVYLPKSSIVRQVSPVMLWWLHTNPSKVDLGLNVWQIGLLHVVLLEYPDKSHNFTNLIFMTSSRLNSIVVDLRAGAGPGLIGHVFLIYSYAKLRI